MFCLSPALAEKRMALVIGNSAYSNATTLANPRNDARALADKLTSMQFTVMLHEDLDGQSFRIALGEFSEEALNADIAMVFYAGHGIEMAGQNYLIPIDARMRSEATAQFETIPLEQVLDSVRGAKKLGMVLLDACRDNPFANSMQRKDGTRAVKRGLSPVPVDGERGLLISFAAEAGSTADDGDTKHSPYTEALLETIDQPGMEINRLFRAVRAKVREKSGGRQVPIEYAQLPDQDIYLVAASAPPPSPAPVAQPAPPIIEDPLLLYIQASARRDLAALEDFLRRYPDHIRAADARRLIEDLKEGQAWAATQAADSADGYDAFLAAYPNSANASRANDRLAALRPPPVPEYTGSCTPLNGSMSVTGVPPDDTLFLRQGGGTGFRAVGELAFNATGLHQVGCANNWCEVVYGCMRGYAAQKYLRTGAGSPPFSTQQGKYSATGFAAGTRIPVLSGPSAQYAAVSELPAEATDIWVSDCDSKPGDPYAWCNVSWRNVAGWVYGGYLVDGLGRQPFAASQPAPVPQPVPAPVTGNSCFDLWYARNAIFAERGYCFTSAEGKKWFDNSQCHTSAPQLSSAETAEVNAIKAREKAQGC
ncbi:MAG: caspase family protein [Pseudotabrizicola sp.]|uniref:caspase family protein n=2 Tax=Pseudotabrizicola sp. TaxID=2939647 RepID=UPI00273056A0|nr:caspase family protein [Pseudotabrizicola sp.]MDZ7576061.1 caspase family protein [Pseudotabrizicola sp.]